MGVQWNLVLLFIAPLLTFAPWCRTHWGSDTLVADLSALEVDLRTGIAFLELQLLANSAGALHRLAGGGVLEAIADETTRSFWRARFGDRAAAPAACLADALCNDLLQSESTGARQVCLYHMSCISVAGQVTVAAFDRELESKSHRAWFLQATSRGSCPEVEQPAHTDAVLCCCIERGVMVTGCLLNTAKVFTVEAGSVPMLRFVCVGHSGPVCSVAVSPSRSVVLTGSLDRTVRMWDVYTGDPLGTYAHKFPVHSVHADGDVFCVSGGTSAGELVVRRIADGSIARSLYTDNGCFATCAHMADGLLVACCLDRSIRTWWSAADGLPARGGTVVQATATNVRFVLLLRGRCAAHRWLPAHKAERGVRIFTASEQGRLHLWHTRSSGPAREAPTHVQAANIKDMIQHASRGPGGSVTLLVRPHDPAQGEHVVGCLRPSDMRFAWRAMLMVQEGTFPTVAEVSSHDSGTHGCRVFGRGRAPAATPAAGELVDVTVYVGFNNGDIRWFRPSQANTVLREVGRLSTPCVDNLYGLRCTAGGVAEEAAERDVTGAAGAPPTAAFGHIMVQQPGRLLTVSDGGRSLVLWAPRAGSVSSTIICSTHSRLPGPRILRASAVCCGETL